MAATGSDQANLVRVMFGGDVMLGRTVKEFIHRHGPGYPLGRIAALMRSPHLTVVNLECAITSSDRLWPHAPKAFYFGAPPEAIDTLTGAGVDMVSLANNHTLDFDTVGLQDTWQHLRRCGILSAGSGSNIAESLSPAILDRHGMRFGMAAFCDHQADFAAQAHRAGIAYLNLDDEPAALAAWRRALATLQHAAVDWPILSLHWGPNLVFRPSEKFRRLAHAAIDMGWKILFGHSAHVFHGIEIYRGCPILYAAGDLVDDYYVDPEFRIDHQLLFELELAQNMLRRIRLYPVFIEDCRTQPANPEQFETIAAWITDACNEFGTRVRRENERIWIDAAAP